MKSKRKFILVLVVFTLSALMLALAATLFLQTQFNKIEEDNTDSNVTRALNVLYGQNTALSVQVNDWASWDDTYNFVKDHNKTYVESNLTNESLQNLGMNFMLFIDTKGKVVEAKGINVEDAEDLEVPEEMLAAFSPNRGLLADSDEFERSGFLGVDKKIALFSARPILNSQGEGPVRGTLIFAKYLLESDQRKLAELVDLELSYQQIGTDSMTPDTQAAVAYISDENTTIKRLPGSKIVGYQLVRDTLGEPLFVARVESSRVVYMDAQRALLYYLAGLVFVVVLAIIVSTYAARQIVAKDKIIQVKDEFFSMASHEIRTPLVAIRGNSQMLKQMYAEHNDADFGQMVDDIHTSSERLIRVVTNFLDLARLEQNRIPFTVESFELDPVVHSVVQEMHNMGNEHGVQIVADIPPVLPAILADKDRVKQILYNLIGNSMKFTEEGSITVGAHADKAHVVVTVTDTGRGIRPEDQKALFEKFRQTSKSDARIGTGLGLYISKILVEKMGGSMRLESSEVGKGTTFSFTLPLATESPKPTNKISPQIQS